MKHNVINSIDARKNFYTLLREVNVNHCEIEIVSEKEENNAVLISRKKWTSIKETLYLEEQGVLDTVREREKDDAEFTEIDELDWKDL